MTTTIDSLRWMAGYWRRDGDGSRQEEVWLEPLGGCMIGLDRDVSPGKVAFEHLRIQEENGRLALHVSLGGKPSISFTLAAAEEHDARFEREGDSFPARIHYWLDGNVLHCRIEGGGRGMEWSWPRAD